jgi:hypothetical protein
MAAAATLLPLPAVKRGEQDAGSGHSSRGRGAVLQEYPITLRLDPLVRTRPCLAEFCVMGECAMGKRARAEWLRAAAPSSPELHLGGRQQRYDVGARAHW